MRKAPSSLTAQPLRGAAIIIALALSTPIDAMSQERRCQCSFAQSPWEAYGTGAACTAVTTNGRTSCNISFGGTGVDERALLNLGVTLAAYRKSSIEILSRYLALQSQQDIKGLTEPSFLRVALLQFMRGGYLRPDVKVNPKTLDSALQAFLAESATSIGAVFRGESAPYARALPQVPGSKISVERGVIQLFLPDVALRTVYLDLR